jgi:hypothetical protein
VVLLPFYASPLFLLLLVVPVHLICLPLLTFQLCSCVPSVVLTLTILSVLSFRHRSSGVQGLVRGKLLTRQGIFLLIMMTIDKRRGKSRSTCCKITFEGTLLVKKNKMYANFT